MFSTVGKLRLLVVDDDESMAQLIGKTLAREFAATHEVTIATEGALVWGLAAKGEVDLCVTDMDMPNVNGFRLLKELKHINPLTQVIFLTAHPTIDAARSAVTMGADDFLPKPVNLRNLSSSVAFSSTRIRRWQSELIAAE